MKLTNRQKGEFLSKFAYKNQDLITIELPINVDTMRAFKLSVIDTPYNYLIWIKTGNKETVLVLDENWEYEVEGTLEDYLLYYLLYYGKAWDE